MPHYSEQTKHNNKLTNATQLHDAARKGDFTKAMSLIRGGAELNSKTKEGLTPLHLACQHERSSVCGLLIRSKANINVPDANGFTPIHIVCQRAFSHEVLSLMLINGANVNAITNDRENALHIVAEQVSRDGIRLKICKELLSYGCEANLRSNKSLTPLHHAAYKQQYGLCKLLLNNRARVDAKTGRGLTALHMVMLREGSMPGLKIVYLLRDKGANINAQDRQGCTPLHWAVSKGNRLTMRFFLSICSPNPNIRDHKGQTPLHIAALRGDHHSVSILLEYSKIPVDINATTTTGWTTLSLAVKSGSKSAVEALLNHGANCEHVGKYMFGALWGALGGMVGGVGNYPPILGLIYDTGTMFEAAKNKETEKVLSLIDHGVIMNARDSEGRTLLHYAAQYGNGQLMNHLLRLGFRLDDTTTNGSTSLHLALIHHSSLAPMLIKHAYDKLDPVRLTEYLEAKLCDTKQTALHIAAAQESGSNYEPLRIVESLIKFGITYNPRDTNSCTPADLAKKDSIKQYFRAIDYLFACKTAAQVSWILSEHPTIVNARDDDTGYTALHRSIIYDRSQQLVKTLLRHGAKVELRDKKGHTVLHFASRIGNAAIIDVLIKECPRTSRKQFVNLGNFVLGWTPLDVAANEAVARKLVHYGARRITKGRAGDHPYDIAPESEREKLHKIKTSKFWRMKLKLSDKIRRCAGDLRKCF